MLKIETTKQVVIAFILGMGLIVLGLVIFTKIDIEKENLGTQLVTSAADGVDFGIAEIPGISSMDNFDVEVYVNTKDNDIGGYDITLEFNPNKLEVDTSQGSDGVDSAVNGYQIVANTQGISDGVYKVMGIKASAPYIHGESELMITIHLRAKSGFVSGDSALNLVVETVADDDAGELVVGNVSGSDVRINEGTIFGDSEINSSPTCSINFADSTITAPATTSVELVSSNGILASCDCSASDDSLGSDHNDNESFAPDEVVSDTGVVASGSPNNIAGDYSQIFTREQSGTKRCTCHVVNMTTGDVGSCSGEMIIRESEGSDQGEGSDRGVCGPETNRSHAMISGLESNDLCEEGYAVFKSSMSGTSQICGEGIKRTSCYRHGDLSGCSHDIKDACFVERWEWECQIGNGGTLADCSSLRSAECGDSYVEGNEQCDDGNTVSGDGCSATCQNEKSNVSLTITPSELIVTAGGRVSYTYRVSNIGDSRLTNIAVVDNRFGEASCPGTELNAGDSMSCTRDVVINETVTNVGTVTASTLGGELITVTSAATVTVSGVGSCSIGWSSTPVSVGETIQLTVALNGQGARAGTCSGAGVDDVLGTSFGEWYREGGAYSITPTEEGMISCMVQLEEMNANGERVTCREVINVVEEISVLDDENRSANFNVVSSDSDSSSEDRNDDEDKYDCDSSIGNYIWYDTNGNGTQDDIEEGIPGIKVCAYNGNDKECDTTNSKGRYEIDDLCAHTYDVVVKNMDGRTQTYDPDGKKDSKTEVEVDEGDEHTKADFGYRGVAPATGLGANIAVLIGLSLMLTVGTLFVMKKKGAL